MSITIRPAMPADSPTLLRMLRSYLSDNAISPSEMDLVPASL